jgi:hypothetical protein
MKIIAHRRNTLAELMATPRELGVEVDIRTRGDRLIMHHDPFADGEEFATWIERYRHGMLILNVKEEGLDERVLELVHRQRIEEFFFLDQSFPLLMKTAQRGERRCAVRVSEYEHIGTALALAGRVEWAWIDCFTRFPLSGAEAARLRDAGFRLCLVSPELQQRTADDEIPALRGVLSEQGIAADAVCTKWPARWTA